MDFTLSKQQQMVQKMYREFAENEVKPLAKKVDAEEYFPKETVEKMGKLGMMGIYFPTSVGGAGGDVLSYVMAVEELSKVCGTTGVIVSAHTSLCAAPIYENGTPEQKAKYLPKLCSGEWLGAFGLTEPGAGTDAQGQQTIAKEEDDCWVLNGSKIFITNAGFADVFIVIAVTDRVLDKKGRPTKLCSAFIVERTDPAFSVGKAEDKMGMPWFFHLRADLRGLPYPEGSYAGRARQGLPAGHGYPGRRSYRHRFSGSGHCRGRSGGDRCLRQGAQAVWPQHLRIPEHPVRAG